MTTKSALLKRELADDRRYHPNLGGITRGGMANHYPMALLALHGLGASDEAVNDFRERWGRRRATIDMDLHLVDRGEVTVENWPEFLGQTQRLLEFRRVFETLLAAAPIRDVVAGALRTMRDGLPMGLFHPLIRLSFACEQESPGFVADALSYAAIRHADLFHAPTLVAPTGGSLAPASVWRRIAEGDVVVSLPDAGALRVCEALCGSEVIHQAALPEGFALDPDAFGAWGPQICELALRLYLFEPALTTLHAVTAAQALVDLTSRAASAEARATYAALWTRYWIWLTALYIEKGRPRELPATLASGALSAHTKWPDLAAHARTIPEVHLVKMAYACRWLDAAFGPNPLYKLAVVNMLREGTAHPRHGGGWGSAAV